MHGREASRSQLANELLRDVEDAKSDELVAIHSAQVLALHLPRKIQRHVVQSHGELLVCIDAAEADFSHLPQERRIGRELEHARTLAVLEIAVAVETAGIACNGERDVVARASR